MVKNINIQFLYQECVCQQSAQYKLFIYEEFNEKINGIVYDENDLDVLRRDW